MYDNKTKLKVARNAEAKRLLKNTQNSRCMYKECCNKPIDSHCYQKSMLEEKLSDKDGMVVGVLKEYLNKLEMVKKASLGKSI